MNGGIRLWCWRARSTGVFWKAPGGGLCGHCHLTTHILNIERYECYSSGRGALAAVGRSDGKRCLRVMHISRPGERVDTAPLTTELDFSTFNLKISTERYSSREYLEREREMLWMRVWQIVGRADEIPEAGDWMEYR